jgi:predicted AAA+ superfamily ATPase
VLPQSLADFARAIFPTIPVSPRLRVHELLSPAHRHALEDMRLHLPQLTQAFDLYLRFGGLPAAVAEAVAGRAQPSPATMRIITDSLVREVQRRGAGESAAHSMLERVARSLGSRVSWNALAEDMDVPLGSQGGTRRRAPSGRTVRDYVEFLAAGYLVMVLYAWKADLAGSDLAREKKLYFGDPLLYRASLDHAGLREDLPALAENVLALALLRRYEPIPQQYRGFVEPTSIHLWRSRRGGEIDFVAGDRQQVDVIEVKYQDRVDHRVFNGLRAAFPGRAIVVASKAELDLLDDRTALVPASLLAWSLG